MLEINAKHGRHSMNLW